MYMYPLYTVQLHSACMYMYMYSVDIHVEVEEISVHILQTKLTSSLKPPHRQLPPNVLSPLSPPPHIPPLPPLLTTHRERGVVASHRPSPWTSVQHSLRLVARGLKFILGLVPILHWHR